MIYNMSTQQYDTVLFLKPKFALGFSNTDPITGISSCLDSTTQV